MFLSKCMKSFYSKLGTSNKSRVKASYSFFQNLIWALRTIEKKLIGNRLKLRKNKTTNKKNKRFLEIGPGVTRIEGFETLNVHYTPTTDYVYDATKALPFEDATFDIVYASHIIEHVPWYQVGSVLREWRRIIAKSGCIEIWTPDLQKIVNAALAAETGNGKEFHEDQWFKFNPTQDPMVWLNGRIFSYGDGTGARTSENWHLSGYNYRLLSEYLYKVGFSHVELMDLSAVRGYNHGWINLGVRAFV